MKQSDPIAASVRLFDDSLRFVDDELRQGVERALRLLPAHEPRARWEPRHPPLMRCEWLKCPPGAEPRQLHLGTAHGAETALSSGTLLRFDSEYRVLCYDGAGANEPRACTMSLRTLGLLLARGCAGRCPVDAYARLADGQTFDWDNDDLLCVLTLDDDEWQDRELLGALHSLQQWVLRVPLPTLPSVLTAGLAPADANRLMPLQAACELVPRLPSAQLAHCSRALHRLVYERVELGVVAQRLPASVDRARFQELAQQVLQAYVSMRYCDAYILADGLRAFTAYLVSHEPVAYGLAHFAVPLFPVEQDISAASRTDAVRAWDMQPRPIADRDEAHRARLAAFVMTCFGHAPLVQAGSAALERLADGAQDLAPDDLARAACTVLAWKWVYLVHLVPLYRASAVLNRHVMQTCSLSPFLTLPAQAAWHDGEAPLSVLAAYRRHAFVFRGELTQEGTHRVVRAVLDLPFVSHQNTPAMPHSLVAYYPLRSRELEDFGRQDPEAGDDPEDDVPMIRAVRKRQAACALRQKRQAVDPQSNIYAHAHVESMLAARERTLLDKLRPWPVHRAKTAYRGMGSIAHADWYAEHQQRLAIVPSMSFGLPSAPEIAAQPPSRRARIFAEPLRSESARMHSPTQLPHLVPATHCLVEVCNESVDELVTLVHRHYRFHTGAVHCAVVLLNAHLVLAVHVYWRNLCQSAGPGLVVTQARLAELVRAAAPRLLGKSAASACYEVREDSPYWLVVRRLSKRVKHAEWYDRMEREGPFVHRRADPLLNS